VSTNGPGNDDSRNIIEALQECNHGGHVIFKKDTVYTVGKPMNLTFLDSIDIGALNCAQE
jgi:galacturan 1,4-alpha-galacturonidase